MQSRAPRTVFALALVGLSFGAISSASAAGRTEPVGFRTHELLHDSLYGTPSFMSGEFRINAPASDPVAVARGFLNAEKSILGIASPDRELRVMTVQGPDEVGMSHVKFQHLAARGVPVFGSELVVHMKGNVVTSFNGTFLPSVNLPASPRLSGNSAFELALDHMKDLMRLGDVDDEVRDRFEGLQLDGRPELGFFNGLAAQEKAPTELAWRVSISGYLYYVSALSGKILDHWDNVPSGLTREIYTSKNTTTLPGTLVCSESKGCTVTDTDEINAWNQFGETYNYFKTTHSRDSYDNKGSKLMGSAHYSSNFQNAYWDGTQMVFGDGFVVNDVTAHELSHAVCQFTANLTYKSQSGALNESYSDVYGAMVDRGDWLMGEDMSIGAIRDLQDPHNYDQPRDMDEYKSYKKYDNGGVHINSGIPNFACYLLSDGGSNKGVTVVGQTRNVTEKIWYRTESTKLTSSSQFADWGKLTVEACGELYGKTSVQCTQTTNAMKAVKVMK